MSDLDEAIANVRRAILYAKITVAIQAVVIVLGLIVILAR